MNKTEVVSQIAEKTGFSPALCAKAMDALERVSATVLLARMKGSRLDQSGAVDEITRATGISREDCIAILCAFEETFGQTLSDKFSFFRK